MQMVSRDKLNSPILASIRHALYSLTIRHHVWRDWGFSVLPSRFVKRPACKRRGGSAIVARKERMCVVIHVRWGTGVPRYPVRDPVPLEGTLCQRSPPDRYCMCLCVLPFVQRRSIHIRSKLMGLVCRAKLRRNPSIWPWPNQVANESWRPAIMGICYRDEARYICHVSSIPYRDFLAHDRDISKTLIARIKVGDLWCNFLWQHEKK